MTSAQELSMHRIRSVGVLSVAKISGLIHAAFGLLFIPLFLLMALSFALAGKQATSSEPNPFASLGPAFAIVMALFMPVFYGVMGFVVGAVGSLLYNLLAGWVGGIQIEIEVAGTQQAAAVASNSVTI